MSAKPKIKRKPKLTFRDEFPHYWSKKAYGELATYTIFTNKLKENGILSGDNLTYEHTYEWDEGNLYAWEISANVGYRKEGESAVYTAFASECFVEIYLYRSNELKRYKKSEIKLLGKIIKIEREYKPTGLRKWEGLEAEKAENNEPIEVICSHCEAKLTGSKRFLIGMGWRLRESGNYCVGCR